MATTDAFGVRRKDTTRGPPLRILSLDGGGVRGYSMLIILQELMHRTFVETHGRAPKRHEIPKPCDHFDLIVGTGTGGLIALMLGRLRMNLETCKDVYVRMTKRVFETDKTFAGIPYRSTLFKASKLEEAIRECVREHTVFEDEGKDVVDDDGADLNSPTSPNRPSSGHPQRTSSSASRYSLIGETQYTDHRTQVLAARYGKPNALLYDSRSKRTKTAVTGVYKGSPRGSSSILLRSYDSRAETAVEPKCTVWQAGRATCATALAFKPIQIGQSVFLDEGAGKYNPAPQALDEAILNEWPGREIGVFVSIGTGKRPANSNAQQHLWWEGFVSGGVGDFAEARRRLISKIEGCEETHQYMLKKHLLDRNVDPANYYRLNVIAGVGEFGMNEWNRLAEISTNTRRYLAETQVQNLNVACSVKLAKIHLAKQRWDRAARGEPPLTNINRLSWEIEEPRNPDGSLAPKPPLIPDAVELPAGDFAYGNNPPHPSSFSPAQHAYGTHGPNDPIPQVLISPQTNRLSWANSSIDEGDKFAVHADEPHTYEPLMPEPLFRRSHDIPRPLRTQVSQQSLPLRPSGEFARPLPGSGNGNGLAQPPGSNTPPGGAVNSAIPPPRPPKTPIQGADAYTQGGRSRPQSLGPGAGGGGGGGALPYPVGDGPPPVVNLARKPELGRG